MEFKVYDSPQKGYKFTNDLIKLRGRKCECCGLEEWLNKPINLQVHHIDGNGCNCTEDNLQLLCPNCHSYTDNFGTKNIVKQRDKISDEEILTAISNSYSIREVLLSLGLSDAGANYSRVKKLLVLNPNIHLKTKDKDVNKCCQRCGKNISNTAEYCPECSHLISRLVERPDREKLKYLIRNETFVSIGKYFNLSDNAIRRWCKTENLPYRKKDIKSYTDEEWEKL